jgi:hypothetical protein
MTLKEAKAALAAAQEAYKNAEEAYNAAGERARVAREVAWEAERAVDRAKPLGRRAKDMLTRMASAPVTVACDRYRTGQEELTATELARLGFATNRRLGAMGEFSITDAGRAKLGGKP